MPFHIYEGGSGKLTTTILRPGARPTGAQIVMIIKRLVAYIRAYWPQVMIILRGDSHFSCPEVHDLLYVLGQGGNARLNTLGAPLLDQAKTLAQDQDRPVRLFTSFAYQAGSWKTPRRIIFKAEVTECGPNPLHSSQVGLFWNGCCG